MRTMRNEKHPMAPDRCPDCEWSNTGLMNYGAANTISIWLCHGCAARRIQRLLSVDAVIAALHKAGQP